MSPVTGLARLAARSLPSVDMGNFSSVTEMNKARPFKFHPRVTGLECSYGTISSPVTEISVAKTEVLVSRLARLLI